MTPQQRKSLKLAASAITEIRQVFAASVSDELRLAALVEIAGAAATLARTIAKTGVDSSTVDSYVSDPADVAPVLGRGAWTPLMTRYVPASRANRLRKARRSVRAAEQLTLFGSIITPRGGDR